MCCQRRKRSLRIELQQTSTCALLLCLAFSPGRRYAQPPPPPAAPVTMQQAVDQALAHNPVLLAAQQNLLSMKGQEVEAGLAPTQTFFLAPTSASASRNSLRLQLALSRLFERGQKRRWRLDSARATPRRPTASTTIRLGRSLCRPSRASPICSWPKRP